MYVSLALALLCAIVLAGERLLTARLEQDWQRRATQETAADSAEVRARFGAFQEETRSYVDAVRARLASEHPRSEPERFALLAREARPDIPLEILSRDRAVIAWNGNRGVAIDTTRLPGSSAVSFVQQGPITSTLVVALPHDGGFIVGKRLFDVSFPISNRFLDKSAFSAAFTSQFHLAPEFHFPAGVSAPESAAVAVDLPGIDGTPIGTAILPRPALSAAAERLHRTAMRLLGALVLCLVVVLAAFVVRPALREARPWVRFAAWIALIWGARWTFLLLEVPNGFLGWRLFDPIYFASPFAWGLARSLGDMALSSAAVFLTVLAIPRGAGERELSAPRWAAPLGVGAAALLFCILLRSLLATVRSAVVDSSLSYNDPSSLFPAPELGVMLVSLFLLATAFIVLGVFLVRFSVRSLRAAAPSLPYAFAWTGAVAAFLVVGELVGALSAHPLIADVPRAVVALGVAGLASWRERREERTRDGRWTVGTLIAGSLAGVLVLIPALDDAVHDLDRDHVELLAREIVRPVDSWLTFVVHRALDDVSGEDAARVLRTGDPDDVEKLAFTRWAKSILSQEGNDCAVTFVDAEGSVVSDFHVGVGRQWFRRHAMDEMPRSTRLVEVEERGEEGSPVKWYRGYAPVFGADSVFLGGVWIELSGANQRMLRGEGEEILRSSAREDFASHHRQLTYFEYYDGALVASSLEEAPLRTPLPAAVAERDDSADGTWFRQKIGASEWEMFYLPDPSRGRDGSGIALGLESLGLWWHVAAYLRFSSFFFVVVLAALGAGVVGGVLAGRRPAAEFRGKLLAAFLVVSVIPLVIVGYSNRLIATERTTEQTEKDLARQTQAVTAALERTLGAGTPAVVARLSDEQCEDLAGALDVDFIVYRGAELQASSKPEMFMAELLDRSLSAPAYTSLMLERRSFFAEEQTIGALPYIVGYRPLLSEADRVVGVVAVPTLFKRNEVESELTQRNALLYGAYAFALLLSVVVGTLLANSISSPVRRLSAATAQLAGGDMEISLRRSSSDELGDLEESFSAMAARLKRSQEQMLKSQKELAWREMAKQVAHEIKNPLTPMKLSLQHLRQAYRDKAPDFGEVLERVSSAVLEQIEALSRIASEFSNVARMPERVAVPVDIHAVLREALALYEGGRFRIETDLRAVPSEVIADREEMRRALINILRNSVQAMGESGTIRVESGAAEGLLTLRLRDSGPGIPREILDRLFEPNFSTKTDGMGLGLSLVRSIIEQSGGTVGIESAPGEGTLVTITLPLRSA